jgi:hypothetical protein
LTLEGVAIELGSLNAGQVALIERIMWRRWDGPDLLEGLMILAPDTPMEGLSDWLRLTAAAEYFRHHRPIVGH